MRNLVRSSALFFMASLLLPLGVATSFSNSLVNTNPISGSTVTVAPSSVTLSVQTPLSDMGNEITVTDPKGVQVDDGTISVNGNDVMVGLKNLTESGFYTVKYSLITNDEDPLIGQYVFSFDAPTQINTPDPTSSSKANSKSGNNFGTTIFVLIILFAAILVLIILSLYARKLYRER